ncbi:MAG: HAD-IA family hydrolase, partial [Betaproteobacteria bacterium]|nr:HAD-IA family hydrolase [Betaproteobacteria bacterium]
WDFGGVLTSSPFEAFADFEMRQGIEPGFIRRVNSHNPDHNAWARLERDELSAEGFDLAFALESEALGHRIAGSEILPLIAGTIRPAMVQALRVISETLKTGCITNNFKAISTLQTQDSKLSDSKPSFASLYKRDIMYLFDHVIESAIVGIRKPDPAIYKMMTEALDVDPERCIYLDDLGINLKPARAMGMQTIKVTNPSASIDQLSSLLQIDLRAHP